MTEGQKFLETTTQTVSWFQGRQRANELELRPLYQRNPVWTDAQKAFLIDSILRGYPVPELYLQLTSDDEGNDKHVVVDGQQRVRACLEFLEDGFALGDYGESWDGLQFKDLTAVEKRAVRQYKFSVRTLPELDDTLIREIFGRLNRNNMALNKQELRNATYWGRFITTMTDLAANDFWVASGLFTSNDFRRMLDIEYISELAVAVLYGPQNKKTSLDQYYEAFEEEFPREVEVRRTFERTIVALRSLVAWDLPMRWSKKSDFYTLFSYVASEVKDGDFPAERLRSTGEALAIFASQVEQFAREEFAASPAVQAYTRAVQRAASDLANRRTREAALRAFIDGTEFLPVERAPSTGQDPLPNLSITVVDDDEPGDDPQDGA